MKNFRKQIAALMAVVLFIGCFGFNGFAAQGDARWELSEDGEWSFWKNGEMVTNKMISETKNGVKKTYFLKEDGIMASDELFVVNDSEDGEYTSYAYPDGHLAINHWVYLNDEGQLAVDDGTGGWYYFGKKGQRFEGMMKEINHEFFFFDDDGKMVVEDFREWEDDNGEVTRYYFQHDGWRAKSKWLNIGGSWYCFNSDGSYKTASTATSSDADYEFNDEGQLISNKAPCREVEALVLNGEDSRTAEVGKKVDITFDVQLATDSNATEQGYTENHDWWVLTDAQVVRDVGRDRVLKYKNGKFTIEYTAKIPNTVEFTAVIDGIKSEPVTVVSDWGSEADDQKAEVIADMLTSEDVQGAVLAIKELSKEIEDTGKLKSTWMKEISALEQLDDAFAMANRNVITQNTTSEANTLMGSGAVRLIGGSLNAEKGETVELIVDKGGDAVLPETFERQVSFDLTINIGGSEASQLDIPVVIKMPIPSGMSGEGLRVYHMTADGPELLDIRVSGDEVTLVTDSFSDYVFAGKAAGSGSGGDSNDDSNNNSNNSSNNSSSSSGSSSSSRKAAKSNIPETPGSWKKLDNGNWQFIQANGAPYANTWIYVNGQWYWINPAGIMAEGWQNINGNRYYLNPENGAMKQGWLQDGAFWYYLDSTGAMKTGWVSVGGKWYFMNTDGVMMFNNMTPDGYQVDASGAWVK